MKRTTAIALSLLLTTPAFADIIALKTVINGEVSIYVMHGTPGNTTDGGKTYNTVVETEPFGEIHLKTPIPATEYPKGLTTFYCAKYEVLTGSSHKSTWAVGQECELKK